MNNTAIVIGAGSAGLIAARELKETGFDVKILEKGSDIGGIWSHLPWKSYTLTSSKWVTEYGCFPMPDRFPDFLSNENMREYVEAFVDHFELRPLIDFGVTVRAIDRNSDGSFDLTTDRGDYSNIGQVVICSGLHGEPFTPDYPGIGEFKGETLHSSEYRDPEAFRGKRVLCVGLGESGVGLSSELAEVADKLVVSSEGVAVAPRVVKYTHNPFDQMQFWPIGRYMIGYQELLTSGLSWFYRKIPKALKKINTSVRLKFYSDYGVSYEQFEQWFPKALVPNHFHVKFWAKPSASDNSGNLTRTGAPPDDIFYLIKTEKLIPRGRVKSFDAKGVWFEDGRYQEVDTIIFNTGYRPGAFSIRFPQDWKYRHQDLFKGCLHPAMPNLAFVGMVRPTIGSIPAMAEMHSRLVAAYFSGSLPLPPEQERKRIIAHDNEHFPHIYFFDEWMERMAAVIGVEPRLRDHWSSVDKLRAFFFGAAMPLRYRMRGPGRTEQAEETYIARVNKVWRNAFGRWATATIFTHLLTPYVLSALVFVLCLKTLGLPALVSALSGIAFYGLYRSVDLFRFVFEIGVARTLSVAWGAVFIKKLKKETPDYDSPSVFQTTGSAE